MKIKLNRICIIMFLVTSVIMAQNQVNKYQYVIVPTKFDFLKQPDQYQLNSLTQFLFKRDGFVSVIEGENYPSDLTENRCKALNANVSSNNSLFKTKLTITLTNCKDEVVFKTKEGSSREKDYKKAYQAALRDAFVDIDSLHYEYQPHDISPLKPAANLVKNKNKITMDSIQTAKVVSKTVTMDSVQTAKVESKTVTMDSVQTTKVEPVNPPLIQGQKIVNQVVNTSKSEVDVTETIYYAQPINNGYQLVDSTPKVRFKIVNTSAPDVFLVENGGGMIYKKGDNYIYEYIKNNTTVQEIIKIKF